MKIHNSYIFIPKKRDLNQESNNQNKIRLPKKFIDYIFEIFGENCKQLQSNIIFELYSLDFSLQDRIYKIYFHIKYIEKCVIFEVFLDENVNRKVITVLEEIQKKLEDSKINNNYVMIVSYDSISEYYCNKAYPKLNILERNLRQLFYKTYVPMYGLDYISLIPEGLKNNAKKVIKNSGGNKKDITLAQKFFYSLNFSDIKDFLFKKEWKDIDDISKEEFLNNHPNLSEVSDEVLRKTINELSPKSDWDRYFKDKIDNINVESLINTLQTNRNKIAHCKFFYKKDYENFMDSFSELNNEIEKAIKIIENNEMYNNNLNSIISSFERIARGMIEFKKALQYLYDDYGNEISNISNNLANIARMAADYLEN